MEKHNYIVLSEMVSVLISYIEIDNYKLLKKRYYKNLLKKVAGAEGFLVVTLSRLWNEVDKANQPNNSLVEKNTLVEVPKPVNPTVN